MNDDLVPIPRLCVLTKSSGADEYGFNLHAEMGRGQFVGAVDIGSAAHMSGLRPGDHIVAVNGESIEGFSHKEVVQKIKSDPVRCSLLVLDEEGVLWHKERDLPISSEQLLKRLNTVGRQPIEIDENEYNYEPAADVPVPVPRSRKTYNQNQQISPPSANSISYGDTAWGTAEESGSCSIALPLSGTGSPLSDPQAEQTPLPPTVELLSAEEEAKQALKQYTPPSATVVVENPSLQTVSVTPALGQTASPPAAAIGRHAAVPVPPLGTLLANGPKPRLCTLQKTSPNQEFGFNLHAERGKGHFIGAVDVDGIAERAGLETGQRIVGVNGRLIFPNTPHKEIVQLIKRDPLRTELLVASEEVDRFYAEFGLAFTYDHVQFFNPSSIPQSNGVTVMASRPRQNSKPTNGTGRHAGHRQKRASSSSTSSDERKQRVAARNEYNASDLRSRGHSLGQRPPTPTSTYTDASSPQPNGQPMAVAVQIERRPDNMTSIEIGELNNLPQTQRLIGIGTPPSSRCDEKSEGDGEEDVKSTAIRMRNGIANQENHVQREAIVVVKQNGQEHKHVIAGGPVSPPTNAIGMSKTSQPIRQSPPALQPLTIYPAYQPDKKSPMGMTSGSESPQSRGSPFEKRDFGKDIFALNAKEARKAICGRKRDPRVEGHMTLEEKHRLILNM